MLMYFFGFFFGITSSNSFRSFFRIFTSVFFRIFTRNFLKDGFLLNSFQDCCRRLYVYLFYHPRNSFRNIIRVFFKSTFFGVSPKFLPNISQVFFFASRDFSSNFFKRCASESFCFSQRCGDSFRNSVRFSFRNSIFPENLLEIIIAISPESLPSIYPHISGSSDIYL